MDVYLARAACLGVLALLPSCFEDSPSSGTESSSSGEPSSTTSSTGVDPTPASGTTLADDTTAGSSSGVGSSSTGDAVCVNQSCGIDPIHDVSCGTCSRPGGANLGCIADDWYCGVKLGYWEAYAYTGVLFGGLQVGRRITLSRPTTVRALGFITAGAGPQARMALYENDPMGDGPATRLAATGAQNLGNGDNEFAIDGVNVEPGDYWIVLHTSINTNVVRTADTDIDNETMHRLGIDFDVAEPFPPQMVNETLTTDFGYNLYMVVEE